MMNQVSTSGVSIPEVRIGSGSIDVTGYNAGATLAGGTNQATGVNSTSGFALEPAPGAVTTRNGHVVLTHMGSNIWICSSVVGRSDINFSHFSGGSKTLAGVLDRIRLTTQNGTDTFDNGSVNILYE